MVHEKMSKKIIFLGAGASKDAEYPLASKLYDELSKENEVTGLSSYKKAWEKFDKNFQLIKKIMPALSGCNDIEYLMTAMSLLEGFHKQQYHDQLNQNHLNAAIECYREQFSYEDAFRGFSECLNYYFGYNNYEMKDAQYDYLRVYLKEAISDGDTIITTNYDVLAERILGDLGLWFIQDGYGFNVILEETFDFYKMRSNELDKKNQEQSSSWIENEKKLIKDCLENKSKVSVLKLHGSVGWLREKNHIVLDMYNLRYMLPSHIHDYQDVKYKPELLAYHNGCLIFPTFMKNYEHPILLDIWAKAADAIQKTSEINFIGYSLPEYDTNIRTLLLPLRTKIENRDCLAKVYVMTDAFEQDTKDRWKNFLGDNIELIPINSFEKYCINTFKN